MFKNLKQKLEYLSVNSQSGKSGHPPSEDGKTDERIESSAVNETDDKLIKSLDQRTGETVEVSLCAQGGASAIQSENSDSLSLSNEELEKTNRVLLSQIRELEDCKKDTGRKLNRRIGELEEQIHLDQQAKRDLEHSYALMLDEKDELITVLKTQVQLLKSNHNALVGSSSDDQEDHSLAKLESSDCPISLEEVTLLKEKVKRLESLLTKCKDTIKSNKERSRQLTLENEEIKKSYEDKLAELQLKHKMEMNSKMADLKEEIKSLTDVRTGLDDQMINLTTKLTEKEKTIESKEKIFNEKMEKVQMDMDRLNAIFKQQQEYIKSVEAQSQTSNRSGTSTSDVGSESASSGTKKDDSSQEDSFTSTKEELEKLKELFELKSKELCLVIDDRETVRKELSNQRQKFAAVLERYDEQMKVVQEELIERMKPGPFEAGLIKEVQTILSEPPIAVAEEPGKCEKSSQESEVDGSSSGVKSDMVQREEFTVTQIKLARVLGLLERCAKEIDSRDAFDNRWKERMSEAESKHAIQLQESQETINRLNSQIMELTNRENLLNANLERARQQSDAILEEQRSEMAALQTTVEELLEREKQLRSQIQRTKMMCDAEVARVTAENLDSVQRLSDTFQETQSTLSDLSKELIESKEHSEMVIGSLERDLDEKCCMLQKTADYIETSGDDALKAAFMKIILECSAGPIIPTKDGDKESDLMPDANPTSDVSSTVGSKNNSQDIMMVPKSPNPDIVSIENCKSSIIQDKKEVKISSQCQQELIDFDHSKDEKQSLAIKCFYRDKRCVAYNSEFIAKMCNHKTSKLLALDEAAKRKYFDELFELRKSTENQLSRHQERCKELEAASYSLVKISPENLKEFAYVEDCSKPKGGLIKVCLEEHNMAINSSEIVFNSSTSQVPEIQQKLLKPQCRSEELVGELTTSQMTEELHKISSLVCGGTNSDGIEMKEDVKDLGSVFRKLWCEADSPENEVIMKLKPDVTCEASGSKTTLELSEDMKPLSSENAKLWLQFEEHVKDKLVETNYICILKLELESLMQENSKIKLKLNESETRLEELGLLEEEMAQKELEFKFIEYEYEETKKKWLEAKEVMELERTRCQYLEGEVSKGEGIKLELQKSHEELKHIKGEVLFLTLENEKLMEKLSTLEKEKENDSKIIADIMQAKESLQEKLDTLMKLLDENKSSFDAEVISLRVLLDEKESSKLDIASHLEVLQKDKESLSLDKQNLQLLTENLKFENIELCNNIKELTEKLEGLESRLHSKETELNEVIKSKCRLEENMEKMEDTLKKHEITSDNLQKLSELLASVKHLEERVVLLAHENKVIIEERDMVVAEKNKMLNHCFNIMSSAQMLMGGASTRILALASKLSETNILRSELQEQLREKEALVISLKSNKPVLVEHATSPTQENETTSTNMDCINESLELSSDTKRDYAPSIQEFSHNQVNLLQQFDNPSIPLVLKEKELEEMKKSYESLLQRCEEAEMALNKKVIYFEDTKNATNDDPIEEQLHYVPPNTFKPVRFEKSVSNFKVMMISEGSSELVKELGKTDRSSSPEGTRDTLSIELEQVKKLLEKSQREVELLKQQERTFISQRSRSCSKSHSSPTSREHLDSLDLSQDIFLTPEKLTRNRAGYHVNSVDEHHQMFIDLSPLKDENKIGFRVENCNEKSDSDLLDISDANHNSHEHQHSAKELTYEYLEKQYHLLTKELERMNSELHFYYANSHLRYHHQDSIGKHDSFLDLTEPTELEYLRNVLYKYMLGTETKTLAKVICMVVRFSDDQTKRILEKEESRTSVFGTKK